MPPKKRPPLRGPSRPIDPRYAPGRPVQRGPDRFGLTLIGISTAFVLLLVFFIARQSGQTTTTTTTSDSSSQSSSSGAVGTQQAQAQATQIADLPRISAADARTQAGAKIVDVRTSQQYQTEHIKGATSIPYTEADKRVAEFPKEGNVILYCQ